MALLSCQALKFDTPRERLEVGAPASWQAASSGHHGEISTGWLDEFSDRGMSRSVDEALNYNQDLQAAAARMRQAKHSSIAGRARLRPSVRGWMLPRATA